jgi:transcription elongation factor GreA
MEKVAITMRGFKRLEEEIKTLKTVDRPTVIVAIAEARAHGDLSENAEYSAAREKQGFIEGRIAMLEDLVARAEIIDVTKLSGDIIRFGATVKLVDEKTEEEVTYTLVSEYEANLDKGMISITSPIARALIRKEVGDSVTVTTPSGKRHFEVLEVRYA